MQKSRGFSLVELLTVIAIIALLSAIIFPVMSTVKAKTRQQSCISQLHELAMRADMYKKDNGKFPLTLGPMYRASEPIDQVKAGTTGTGGELPGLFIRGYIDNFRLFHCPSQLSDDMTAGVTYNYDASNAALTVSSYVYSSYDYYTGTASAPITGPEGIRYAYRWGVLQTGPMGSSFATLAPASPYPMGTTDSEALQQQDYQRQLCWRNPPSDTVLTWCSYHAEDPEGTEPKGMVAVVFVDGHTSTMPADQVQACRWRVRMK